ncbi:MAG: hypothetical protein RLZZ373_844 [Pseudomonadota bacterium]|jgi:integrase
MGLFARPDSPFWWCFLEGTRRKINTRVPHAALTPEGRKALKAAAESIYHQHMVQLAKARVGLETQRAITFTAYADWYEQHVTAQHKSAESERSTINTLRRFFGPTLLQDIRPALVTEYEAGRVAKGRKRSTIASEINLLRSIINRAVGEHLTASPLVGLRVKRAKSRPKRTVTADEEPALLAALEAVEPELRDLYLVGVGTLLRAENLITLRRHQLRGTTLVVDAKAGPHSVDLTGPTELQTRALGILQARTPTTHDGLFFPVWGAQFTEPDGDPHSRFLNQVRPAFAAAGLPWGLDRGGLVWHSSTRATGATRMLRDHHIDARTIQLMGPWSSLDQMMGYLGLPPVTHSRDAPGGTSG